MHLAQARAASGTPLWRWISRQLANGGFEKATIFLCRSAMRGHQEGFHQ